MQSTCVCVYGVCENDLDHGFVCWMLLPHINCLRCLSLLCWLLRQIPG